MIIEYDSIESAIQDLQDGKFIVLLDRKDRENEGDLIAAGAKVTPQMIHFMLTYARGAFIATFMDDAQCERLNLPFMVPPEKNNESNKTNFRYTCDATIASSGCSAIERAQTVNILSGYLREYKDMHDEGTLVKAITGPEDLVRPGHVQPISSHPDGLRGRQGHTDGGYTLVKLAGYNPTVAVDMEILDPTGNMAREEHLTTFAKQHKLKIVSIDQLCSYLSIRKD